MGTSRARPCSDQMGTFEDWTGVVLRIYLNSVCICMCICFPYLFVPCVHCTFVYFVLCYYFNYFGSYTYYICTYFIFRSWFYLYFTYLRILGICIFLRRCLYFILAQDVLRTYLLCVIRTCASDIAVRTCYMYLRDR